MHSTSKTPSSARGLTGFVAPAGEPLSQAQHTAAGPQYRKHPTRARTPGLPGHAVVPTKRRARARLQRHGSQPGGAYVLPSLPRSPRRLLELLPQLAQLGGSVQVRAYSQLLHECAPTGAITGPQSALAALLSTPENRVWRETVCRSVAVLVALGLLETEQLANARGGTGHKVYRIPADIVAALTVTQGVGCDEKSPPARLFPPAKPNHLGAEGAAPEAPRPIASQPEGTETAAPQGVAAPPSTRTRRPRRREATEAERRTLERFRAILAARGWALTEGDTNTLAQVARSVPGDVVPLLAALVAGVARWEVRPRLVGAAVRTEAVALLLELGHELPEVWRGSVATTDHARRRARAAIARRAAELARAAQEPQEQPQAAPEVPTVRAADDPPPPPEVRAAGWQQLRAVVCPGCSLPIPECECTEAAVRPPAAPVRIHTTTTEAEGTRPPTSPASSAPEIAAVIAAVAAAHSMPRPLPKSRQRAEHRAELERQAEQLRREELRRQAERMWRPGG